MNRVVVAAVMGFLVVGCATAVEDPQPIPAPEQEQSDPPPVTLSGDLNGGISDVGTRRAGDVSDQGGRQKPPIPFNQEAD